MKVIDLLNEVANGRIPHNVKLEGDCIFDLDELYCCLSDADIGLNDTIEVIEEENENSNENSNKILSNNYEELTIYDNLNEKVLAKITSDEVSTATTFITVKLKPRI